MNIASLTTAELSAALTNGVIQHGLDWGEEAAIRLLIAQGTWLRRDEFHRHITASRTEHGRIVAWVDWADLASEPDGSPASRGELSILRLACHLAGHLPEDCDNRWAISEVLVSLDATNAMLASRAVAMAAIGPDTVGPLQ